jgi:hemolysin activation/secretion protein
MVGIVIATESYGAVSTISSSASDANVNPANITWNIQDSYPKKTVKNKPFQVVPSDDASGNGNVPTEGMFTLRKVTLIGAKFPVPKEVSAVYKQALNKPITLSNLLKIAQDMQSEYRNLGYLLVRVVVPPQEIDQKDGNVKFQIIEGQIEKVVFEGDDPRAAGVQLHRYARAIEQEDPVTYQTIDHFLMLANNLPGIDVTATLTPSKNVTGGADLIIDVKQTPQSGFLSFNNYGTQYIGPGQALVGGSIYDIFGADSLSVSGATSTSQFNQLNYISASYDIVVGPYSTEINPSISNTQTRPGNSLAVYNMYGNSTRYTLNVNQPLIASSAQNLTLNTSVYHLNSLNTAFNSTILYDDDISALTLGLTYQGIFLQSQNNIDAYTTVGLPVFGVRNPPAQPTSRSNGKTQFIMLNFDTSTTHYLTRNLSFNLSTTGQVTQQPLLSSEQIGYGGMMFGQGFTPYIISGDNGVFGDFALRYNLPNFWQINLLQPEIFYSAGVVGSNEALAGTVSGASASSMGVGLNMLISKTLQIGMTLAKPLTLTQVTNSDNGWQALVNVVAVFN